MIDARITGDIPKNVQVGDVLELRGTARVVAVREDLVDVSRFNGGAEFLPAARHVELFVTATFEREAPARPPLPPRPAPPVRTVADSEDRSVRGRTLRPWRR